MAKTEAERKAAHARSQQIHSKTDGFKTTRTAWMQSPAGRQAVKKNNQTQRDKRRDALNRARAEDQQKAREAERNLTEAKEKWGEPYTDKDGVRRFRKPKGQDHGEQT
ncbi:hypothetical protein KAR91_42450 [Candidatus Pacearchaeota archaeon]|nr:hypothetical protein [Candidatus Pacearchaeota archaeon]